MDGELYISLEEMLMLESFLGSPVLLASAILLVVILRRRLRAGWIATLSIALLGIALAVLASVPFSFAWPPRWRDPMLLEVVWAPALASSLLIFPLVGLSAAIVRAKRRRG